MVSPRDEHELNFVSQLLERLGADFKKMEEEELEDLGLAILMQEADRSEKVSEEEIFAKLK